jgi:hypothetical protein
MRLDLKVVKIDQGRTEPTWRFGPGMKIDPQTPRSKIFLMLFASVQSRGAI